MPVRKSDSLKPGDEFTVRTGEFKGKTATIVDATVFPPGHDYQRKITVEVEGETVYMLPRFLETAGADAPEAHATPAAKQVSSAPAAPAGAIDFDSITDLDDPRLDPFRPDPSVVKGYIGRKILNGQQDVDFLLTFHSNVDKDGKPKARDNVMLVGDTQAGKTMLVNVLAVKAAQAMGLKKPLPVFTLSGSSGVTDFDLFGQPTAYSGADGIERLVWLHGVVDLAARLGGILYLDEVNMMGERVTSSLHPLCDYRRTFVNRQKAVESGGIFLPEQVKASEDLWIVGTINPGYKGAGALQEAFTNRFVWIPWTYDDAVEKKLIPSAAVRLFGQALREARAARAINTPIGTAALSRLCEHIDTHGVETAFWMIQSMFTQNEKGKVEAIIEDRSILTMVKDEIAAKKRAEDIKNGVIKEPEATSTATGDPLIDAFYDKVQSFVAAK